MKDVQLINQIASVDREIDAVMRQIQSIESNINRRINESNRILSKNEVLKYSPLIADMVALNTANFTIEEIAKEISDRVLD